MLGCACSTTLGPRFRASTALKVDCLDESGTEGEQNELDVTYDEISTFAFDEDALGEARSFQIAGFNPNVICIRGDLVEPLESVPGAYVGELDVMDG